MNVGADGRVTIRDFGTPTIEAPNIERAVELAVERGWEQGEIEPALVAALKEMQTQAIEMSQKQGRIGSQ